MSETLTAAENPRGRRSCLYLHNVNLGLVNENHIILKLETTTRPMSPAFPLVSSTESMISRIFSPLRSFLWLWEVEARHERRQIPINSVYAFNYLHAGNIKFDFSILPYLACHGRR